MNIQEKAYAKINISLDIARKRDDGYHEIITVMQTVSLADDITITPDGSGRVHARCSLRYIPGDERNLAVKAALRYLEAIGERTDGLRITVEKHIPVGAGMGGGSADAAAVLRGMDRLYGGRLGKEALERLAADIGSDVAFCIKGGTMLATGRGEILSPLPPMPECFFAICKPSFSISTPELFNKLDRIRLTRHPDTAGITEALRTGDLAGLCRRMYNVFEDVDDRRLRTVSHLKSELLDHGALGAVMTGTGSAVFGVFNDPVAAEKARDALSREVGFACTAVPVSVI